MFLATLDIYILFSRLPCYSFNSMSSYLICYSSDESYVSYP